MRFCRWKGITAIARWIINGALNINHIYQTILTYLRLCDWKYLQTGAIVMNMKSICIKNMETEESYKGFDAKAEIVG